MGTVWSVIGNSIAKSEQVVCNFFQKKQADSGLSVRAKKVHELFEKTPLDFIICEGSLKKDLLKKGGFTDGEAAFFNSKAGAISFCQFTEFFMNGFKFGQAVEGFPAEKYIQPISTASFCPLAKSTVFFPPSYKGALEEKFAKAASSVFSISGEFDKQSEITTMSLEML